MAQTTSEHITWRRPPASGLARELSVEVGGVRLSGLVAHPPDGAVARATVVAVHGAEVHAGYFHAHASPELSLLELGARNGYLVWAPDRPGIGATADLLADDDLLIRPQAELLLDALDVLADGHDVGGGVLLVGHSYGLKVAMAMAAQPRGQALLGLDGAGAGARYAFTWGAPRPERPAQPGDRGPSWGPGRLYPPATFTRGNLPLHAMPEVQAAENAHWPAMARELAPSIGVPVRLTFGEHEGHWPTDAAALDELRALFTGAPEVAVEVEPHTGHNLSLGWSARAYHLKVLAFLERCLTRAQQRS